MPQAYTRVSECLFGWARSTAWRQAAIIFLVMRLVLTIWMWGIRQVFDQDIPPHPVLRPYLNVAIETNPWLEPWQRWDAIHYQAIAERGYPAFESSLFTPPLFPLIIQLVHDLTGMNSLLAGIIISNLAFLASLAALYRLVEFETGDHKNSRRTLVYLASFPTAFFFLAGYTESLFLLGAILSIYSARKKHWISSGIWGAVASLSRLTGALILLPLVFVAWQATRQRHDFRPWSGFFLAVIGAAIFPLYTWFALHQSPWAPLTIQTARFHGGFSIPGYNLIAAMHGILTGKAVLADWFDLSFLLLFLATMPFVIRRLPAIYTVYQATFLLLYLSRLSEMQPLLGTSRYVLALFPGFIAFSSWGQKSWVNRVYLYGSWAGLLLLSGQFAIWGWVS